MKFNERCHEPRDSLLSSSREFTNYRGILNLCIIILVLSNIRVALENVLKYGVLIDPIQWVKLFFGNPTNWPTIQLVLSSNWFILVSFCIEKYGFAKSVLNEFSGLILITLNLTMVLALSPIVIQFIDCHPIGSSIACSVYSILSLKLVSYHMVNYWCRKKIQYELSNHKEKTTVTENEKEKATVIENHKEKTVTDEDKINSNVKENGTASNSKKSDYSKRIVRYPNNLHLNDMYYFIFAPTLCYELNFPRNERIRKRFLMKRLLEIFFLLILNLGLIQQWMVPTISNSFKPFQEMNFTKMLERLLKLAIPNHIIWLIFFYWYFHSFLNAMAEIMKFGDREFYRDWWNSESVNYFWQNWNVPVHKWCVRHLYIPLINRGFNRFQASIAVFLVSAFFHEYLVSVPLKMFRLWAFFGMLSQIPFSIFVSKYLNRQYANVAVWISLIIGQPLCILMYYHDYYVINYINKGN